MIEVLIWESRIDGGFPIKLYRYQSRVLEYEVLRYRLQYGAEELSDLTHEAVFDHLPRFLRHQLEASGRMG